MRLLTLALFIAAASAAECTDTNVVAKQKLVDAVDKLIKEKEAAIKIESDAGKKKTLEDDLVKLKEDKKGKDQQLVIAKNMCTPGDAAPEPVDAIAEQAKGNNAKAVQELTEWSELRKSEEKNAAGYDKMDTDAKKKWDDAYAAKQKPVEERDAAEKKIVDFDNLTLEQRTIYLGILYKWKEAKYKACKADPKSDDCVHADALRKFEETKRAKDGYYKKDAAGRQAYDKVLEQARQQNVKDIIAAAKPKVDAKPGVGTDCSKDANGARAACAEGHCCGGANVNEDKGGGSILSAVSGKESGVKTANTLEVCDVKTNTKHTTKLGKTYFFKCIDGAQHLATAAVSLALASYMMA